MKTIITSNEMSTSNNRCGTGGKSSTSNNNNHHQRMASSSLTILSSQGETQAFMYMPLNNNETFQDTHLDQNKIQVFLLLLLFNFEIIQFDSNIYSL